MNHILFLILVLLLMINITISTITMLQLLRNTEQDNYSALEKRISKNIDKYVKEIERRGTTLKTITYFNDTAVEKVLHTATNCDIVNADEVAVDIIEPQQLVKVHYKQENLLIKDWGKVIMFKEYEL